MSGDQEPKPQCELVLPFVACVSKGGPYEDQAFAAGFQAGEIHATLGTLAKVLADLTPGHLELTWTVRSGLIPQLGLIAMHHGFRIVTTVVAQFAPEWTTVTFTNGRKDLA